MTRFMLFITHWHGMIGSSVMALHAGGVFPYAQAALLAARR